MKVCADHRRTAARLVRRRHQGASVELDDSSQSSAIFKKPGDLRHAVSTIEMATTARIRRGRTRLGVFPPPPTCPRYRMRCGGNIAHREGGYPVVAIELSQGALKIARDRFPALDFRVMDATTPVRRQTFDAAFSYNGIV